MRSNVRQWALGAGLVALSSCRRTPPVDADLVVRDVTVIDGTAAPARPHQSVAVKGGRIVAIGSANELVTAERATVVDGANRYLIPGLWDMHAHLFGYMGRSFPLFLANGVTSIRDLSDALGPSIVLRDSVKSGRILGPDFLIAGPTLDSPLLVKWLQGTPFAASRESVPDSATGVAMVDSLSRVHVDQIKVHSMTPRSAYFAIVARGKELGIPVVGHVPDSVSVEEAIRAGQRSIEHSWKIALAMSPRAAAIDQWKLAAMQRAFAAAPGKRAFLPTVNLRVAADDSGLASFDSATATRFSGWAAAQSVWFDPTLVVLMTVTRRNEDSVFNRPETKYVPKSMRNFTDGPPRNPHPTEADLALGRKQWANVMRTFAPLVASHAKFVTGTDIPIMPLVPGFSVQWEMELLVQIGLTPLEALRAATHNSAEAAGRLADLGTIEVGKQASLVLLDADPLANIANVKQIRAVLLRGQLLDRAALDRMLVDAAASAETH